MRMAVLPASLLLLTAGLAYSQTGEKPPNFDVASVKPAARLVPGPGGAIAVMPPSGGPGTNDPGRFNFPHASLKILLMRAYDVKNFQITGPAWFDTDWFEVTATMPPETTREQFRLMLQNLLAERFKLALHRETKELPIYTLVVAKGGPRMKESGEVPPPKDGGDPSSPPPVPAGPLKAGPDGFPVLPGIAGRVGFFNFMMNGNARMIAHQQTMENLASRLTTELSRPVKDATGLKAKYDFTLTYEPEQRGPAGLLAGAPPPPPPAGAGAAGPPPAAPTAEPLPDIYAALQQQLGLKLEPGKGPVELIVVDHCERTPTEN